MKKILLTLLSVTFITLLGNIAFAEITDAGKGNDSSNAVAADVGFVEYLESLESVVLNAPSIPETKPDTKLIDEKAPDVETAAVSDAQCYEFAGFEEMEGCEWAAHLVLLDEILNY